MKKEIIQGLFWVLMVSVAAFAADPAPAALPVWDFEQGIVNDWGGHYNVYQRAPSWARTYLDPRVSRSKNGHSLRVTTHRDAEGFCGMWMDLAGDSGSPEGSQDATSYRYLSFWIKGERGGEDFELTLADITRTEDESLVPRRLSAYLPRGVTANWQEVLIPLADFPELDMGRLARLILHFTTRGDYRFYLDEIALKRQKSSPTPSRSDPEMKSPGGALSSRDQALWVWNTKALFEAEERDRFLAFCSANGIREIYLAVEFSDPEEDPSRPFEILAPDQVRHLVERAHQQGLRVDALAGTPEWAMEEKHSEALAAADAVLKFNRASPPPARFDGLHFDVEPYLLLGYDDPAFGRRVREEFLAMVSQVATRVRAEPNLRFSCDVPSWFYPTGGPERQDVLATFRGEEKAVGEHLTDMLDAVTIMDYINQADGAGGIIARGIAALEYAASQGKKIVVGVETFLEPDRTIHFMCHIPKEEFAQRLNAAGLAGRLYFGDFRLAAVSDGKTAHLGLSAPADMTGSQRADFEDALLLLARKFNEATDTEHTPVLTGFDAARAALAKDPDWRGFENIEITDPENNRTVQGFRSVRRMSPRITFHGLGRRVFEEEAESSVEWLGRHRSFGGLAIHFYDSFRELLEGK